MGKGRPSKKERRLSFDSDSFKKAIDWVDSPVLDVDNVPKDIQRKLKEGVMNCLTIKRNIELFCERTGITKEMYEAALWKDISPAGFIIQDPLRCTITETQFQAMLPVFNNWFSYAHLNLQDLKDIFKCNCAFSVKNNRLLYYLFIRLEEGGYIARTWQNEIGRYGIFRTSKNKPISPLCISKEISMFRHKVNGEMHGKPAKNSCVVDNLILNFFQ